MSDVAALALKGRPSSDWQRGREGRHLAARTGAKV